MEFRVLGPLEVLEDGHPLTLGGPHPRAVLAILVLHRNDIVSRDRLIDEIWGASPPETAQTALQVHVSHLRKALGGERIETRPPGYCLRLGAQELDADRFHALVARARGAPPAEASETLRHALAMWRGRSLSDLDEMVARPERARLEEERMAALELRIAADLDLARHEALVPELEGLVREHPLREWLRGQLMVALYRSGRQADALEVYRSGRRLLDEELGLQPGEELRRLERAILEQDASLAAPAASGVTLEAEARGRLSRRARAMAATGVVALAAAVAAVVVAVTRSPGPPDTIPANSVAVVEPGRNAVVADIAVGRRPIAVAIGEGAVWVANADDGTVSRIDPDRREVLATVGIGSPASDIAAGGGSVWVANGSAGTVSRVDPSTNSVVDTFDLGGSDELLPAGMYAITVGFGSVWVGSGEGKILRLDPETGDVVTLAIDRIPADIAAGEGAIWVVTLDGRTLRIDPRTNAVTGAVAEGSFPLPLSIAAGGGSVWMGQPGETTGTVWRIHPATVRLTGTTDVYAVPRALATTSSAVWVAGGAAETLVKLHPRSGRVLATINFGNAPLDVAAGDGQVWVSVGSGDAST